MQLTDRENHYDSDRKCPNQKAIAILDPATIADGCSLNPVETNNKFRMFRDSYRDYQHRVFKYQKFHEKFFDTIELTGDSDYFVGRIQLSYNEFLRKLKKYLNVKGLANNDEHFEEILLSQVEKLEKISDRKTLEREFPEVYADFIAGENLRHSFEPVLQFGNYNDPSQRREIIEAEARKRYYYNCGLRYHIPRFVHEQGNLYRNMITKRQILKEYIQKRPLNGYWMRDIDPDKFELYVASCYLDCAKDKRFTEEARKKYLDLLTKYFAHTDNKDVEFFDYRKNENITYANVYSEFVSLVSNLVGWELLPEGSPIRKPKEEKDVPRVPSEEEPKTQVPSEKEPKEKEPIETPSEPGIIDLTDPEVIKKLTGAEDVGDAVMMNLYEANKAKVMFYKDSGYIGTAMGVKLNKGYIAFIYPNGVVVMDVISTKETMKDAIGNGIYAVKADDFLVLSALPKSELRSLKDKRDFLYHSGDWEERLSKIISREGTPEEREAAVALVRTLEKNKQGRK